MQCYEKDQYWAACQLDCRQGIDPRDDWNAQTRWSCNIFGPRTPGEPITTTTEHTTVTTRAMSTTLVTTMMHASEDMDNIDGHAQAKCIETGKWFSPNLKGESLTVERSWEACHRRCMRTDGCAHFAFLPDKSCHLQGSDATLVESTSGGGRQVISGPRNCDGKSHDGGKASIRGGIGRCSITRKEDCSRTQCCSEPGMACYEKNEYWSACQLTCTPGIDPRDKGSDRTPWTCRPLGPRTPGDPIVTTTSGLLDEPHEEIDVREVDREEEGEFKAWRKALAERKRQEKERRERAKAEKREEQEEEARKDGEKPRGDAARQHSRGQDRRHGHGHAGHKDRPVPAQHNRSHDVFDELKQDGVDADDEFIMKSLSTWGGTIPSWRRSSLASGLVLAASLTLVAFAAVAALWLTALASRRRSPRAGLRQPLETPPAGGDLQHLLESASPNIQRDDSLFNLLNAMEAETTAM